MSKIAIMQGRLGPPEAGRFQSFPRNSWREEFHAATEAGLDAIEWIYDLYGEDVNPLATDSGFAEMQVLADQTGVMVRSVCADYFMDVPILRDDNAQREELHSRMIWLIGRCKQEGIVRMVVPFVDASKITSSADQKILISFIQAVLPHAEETGVEIHLETDLGPSEFADLLAKLDSPLVKANYDSGNSASHGYKPIDEFAAYGERIGSVHIKDRILHGGTVPLGTGDADLPELFQQLASLNYKGDYVLQVAREEPGNETAWAKHNVELLKDYLKGAGIAL